MASSPLIITHTIAGANTEETITLPQNVRDFTIRLRNTTQSVKLAFTATQSGSNYVTLDSSIPAISGEDVDLYRKNIYVQAPTIGTVLEVLVYVG